MANAASITVHTADTLMLSTDTGDLRIADGTNVFSAIPASYIVAMVGGTQTLTNKTLTSCVANTAAVDTNTTQIASTAFVLAQAAAATPLADGTAAVGTSTQYARADHVHPAASTVFPSVIASGDLTAQSAAVSSVATYTPAGTSTIRISAYLNITSVVTDVIVITVTYKDENGTSQSISSSSISAVGNNSFDLVIRSSANAIVVKTTLTTGIGSIAYDVGAIIERLS